jgi:hypothetical protein
MSYFTPVIPALLLSLILTPVASVAQTYETTKVFSGRTERKVQENARVAGFLYPAGPLHCSANHCRQRWGRVD